MSRAGLITAILALGLAIPTVASAQLFGVVGETERSMQIEFKFGPYTPNIDASGGGNAYAAIYQDPMFMFRTQLDYQLGGLNRCKRGHGDGLGVVVERTWSG